VTRLYVRVLVLEAAILVALYLFGRAFSYLPDSHEFRIPIPNS
jgi:hypothetical protein